MTLTRADIGCWLINLPRATDRRRKMEAQLATMDLPYNVFDGVDGRAREAELLRSVDVPAFERNTGGILLPGKMGCYHSHLGVWQALLASGKPAALVLEDDIVFHDDFLESVDAALSVAAHWDLVRFNCIRAKIPVPQGTVGRYTLNAYIGPFTGNGAYLVKRELVERLLPRMLPMTRPLDHELNRFFVHHYRQRGLEPWSSHPDDEGLSTITGLGFGDVRKFRWYQRMPYYRLKLSNYLSRAKYLWRTGALRLSRAPLDHGCSS